MKNIDYIKSLDVEDMAEWYNTHVPCGNCHYYDYCMESKYTNCAKVIKQWLNEERK